MSVKECAQLMGKSMEFVRAGLRHGTLPFGSAVKMSSRWTYHICEARVYEYMGLKKEA